MDEREAGERQMTARPRAGRIRSEYTWITDSAGEGTFSGFERLINVLKGGRNDQMRRERFSGSEETSRRQKCRVRRGNVNRPDGKKMSFQLGCFSSFIPKLHSSL